MSKKKANVQKSKRNKKYTGDDADRGIQVTKYKAEKKSKLKEYYQDNKVGLISKGIQLTLVLVAAFLLWLVYSLVF